MKKIILIFLSSIFFATILYGEDIHYLSIEWLVDSSDYIAIAKIDNLGEGRYDYKTKFCFSLKKVLKPQNGEKKLAPIVSLVWPASSDWVSGDNIVMFCRIKDSKPTMFYQYTLNDLARGIGISIKKDGEIISDSQLLLKIIEKRIKENKKIPVDCIADDGDRNTGFPYGFIRIYPDSITNQNNFSGVIVPPDPEFKEQILKRMNSEYQFTKADAIASLSNYYDPKLIPILKEFLNDFRFEIVQASYEVLRKWNVDVKKPKVLKEK